MSTGLPTGLPADVPADVPHPFSASADGAVGRLLSSASAGVVDGGLWRRLYRRRMLIVDAVAIIGAVLLAHVGRFELLANDDPQANSASAKAAVLSVLLAAAWFIALDVIQSRDISLVGVGSEEYRRVVSATAWVFGLVAVCSLIAQTQFSRGYLVIALPVGLVGLIGGRHLLRRNLGKRRARGEFMTRVVVLGMPDSISVLCDYLSRSTPAGYQVVGVCIPEFEGAPGQFITVPGGSLPVLGDQHSVEIALRLTNADALAVTAVEQLGQDNMKKLAWQLDSLDIDMIVVPGMADVAGPRLKLRPIDNLPLFHIARPRYDGPSSLGKRVFDLVFAFLALVAIIPIMIVVAVAIKLDSPGPVIFRQERVGQHGKRFRILKFRTMVVGAESVQDKERAATQSGDEIFFKSAADSRITRVGRFLRATSIDELPQLFNVVGGSMSIVGPRPLAPGEGESVVHFVQRRALVKPGMTGLWQVCGRSDVSEAERIRLDHSYVDNWSGVQDLIIIFRTIRTVLKREGAY